MTTQQPANDKQGPPGYGPPPGQPGYGAPPQQGYGPPPGQQQQPQWGPPSQDRTQIQMQQQAASTYQSPAKLKAGQMGPCPPGLEYLAQIDQLIIKQQVELLEVLTGFETNNRYRIYNSMGQQIMYAAEETDFCMRQCCGPARGFTLHITDNNSYEVMRITREFKCCAGCCWCADCNCCGFEVQIEAPVGQVIAYARQRTSCWAPRLVLYDADRNELAELNGPCCVCNSPCCGDVEFPIVTADTKEPVGMCAKQWTGMLLEMMTDADTFSVRFPLDLDVKVKSAMIAAMFLIDFMFFEQKQNNN